MTTRRQPTTAQPATTLPTGPSPINGVLKPAAVAVLLVISSLAAPAHADGTTLRATAVEALAADHGLVVSPIPGGVEVIATDGRTGLHAGDVVLAAGGVRLAGARCDESAAARLLAALDRPGDAASRPRPVAWLTVLDPSTGRRMTAPLAAPMGPADSLLVTR